MASASPTSPQMTPEEAVRRVAQAREMLVQEIHKVIIGQDEMLEQMLICIFARGHCLTIGVPGLAKTLTISTLAQALHLKFSRIQFTPDLMPSDITGTEIIDQDPSTGKRDVPLRQGARSSPTSCWPTRSTAPRRRRRPPCSRRCRNTRSPRRARPTSSSRRSSSWPRRTRSSRKAPIRCPRPSWTASCSRSTSATRRGPKSARSCWRRRRR